MAKIGAGNSIPRLERPRKDLRNVEDVIVLVFVNIVNIETAKRSDQLVVPQVVDVAKQACKLFQPQSCDGIF